MLNRELMEILLCPCCKGKLIQDQYPNSLLCKTCSLLYPIENDVPILIRKKAKYVCSADKTKTDI